MSTILTRAKQIAYKALGIGAVQRTVEDKLRECVSVKDFGAVGDGITDDTQAIQKAIDSLPNGGVVLINTSSVVSLLTIPANRIKLCGGGKLIQKTATNTNLIFAAGRSDVIVTDLWLDGGTGQILGGNKGLVYLEDCNNCFIIGNKFTNAASNAIEAPLSNFLSITDNVIFDSYANGIIAGISHDVVISGNKISNTTTQNGIFITASFGSIPTTDRNYNFSVFGNVISNAGDIGIELGQNTDNSIVTGNTIKNSMNANILVRDVHRCIVCENTLDGNQSPDIWNKTGIAVVPWYVADEYNLIILGNIIKCDGRGVDAAASHGVYIKENVIRGPGATVAGSSGIRTSKLNTIVENNSVIDFETLIVIAEDQAGEDVSEIFISNNILRNYNSRAIVAYNHLLTNVRILDNRISGPGAGSVGAIGFPSCTANLGLYVDGNIFDSPLSSVSSYSGPVPLLRNGKYVVGSGTQYGNYRIFNTGHTQSMIFIELDDSEWAMAYVKPAGLGISILSSSTNWSVKWTLVYNVGDQALLLQRVASTSGVDVHGRVTCLTSLPCSGQ